MPGDEEKTPADSKVAGLAKIDGRPVAVSSNDFTVMAATSSRVASHKEAELKALATKRGVPIVYLAEAGGARMPDIMGSAGIASFGNSTYYGTRRRQVPMVTAVLGQSYGLPTWNACLSDIVVMWTGASMAVSGPRVLELATGEKVSAEDLGGVKVHRDGLRRPRRQTDSAWPRQADALLPALARQRAPPARLPGLGIAVGPSPTSCPSRAHFPTCASSSSAWPTAALSSS
jgi:acetyl-CoA carboxylase carboxyltransferase component